jgi:hypothetical protein
VIEAVNGADSVVKAVSEHPDLVLMDIQLRGLDGHDATLAIWERMNRANVWFVGPVSGRNVNGRNFSYGSWPCENAEAGSLTGLDCSAAKLRELCKQFFPISPAT